MIVKPTNKDFLVGKEFFCQENLGNEHFKTLISQHAAEFERARKVHGVRSQAVNDIKEHIVAQIETNGGRFLIRVRRENDDNKEKASKNDLEWTVTSHADALARVVTAFRKKRKEDGLQSDEGDENETSDPEVFIDEAEALIRNSEKRNLNGRHGVECELTFTSAFNAMNIKLPDDGLKRIVDTFGDNLLGIAEFLALLSDDGDKDRTMKELKLNGWVLQKRLEVFSAWYETVYSPAPKKEKPSLDRSAFVAFTKEHQAANNRKSAPDMHRMVGRQTEHQNPPERQPLVNEETEVVKWLTEDMSFLSCTSSEMERWKQDAKNLAEKKRTRDARSIGAESSSSSRATPNPKSHRVTIQG